MGNAEICDFENHIYLFFKLKKEKWDNTREKTSLLFSCVALGAYRVASIIHKAHDFWKEMIAINLGKLFLQTLGM